MIGPGDLKARQPSLSILAIVAFLFLCVGLAGGYALGTRFPAGNLRSPVVDQLYKFKIVAVPKSNSSGGNYDFEKHFKETKKLMQEVGLEHKVVTLDNGVFKFVTIEN